MSPFILSVGPLQMFCLRNAGFFQLNSQRHIIADLIRAT